MASFHNEAIKKGNNNNLKQVSYMCYKGMHWFATCQIFLYVLQHKNKTATFHNAAESITMSSTRMLGFFNKL